MNVMCLGFLRDQKRVRGNELFQRKEYDRAINSYQKGLNMLENFLEEVIKKIGQVQSLCYLTSRDHGNGSQHIWKGEGEREGEGRGVG